MLLVLLFSCLIHQSLQLDTTAKCCPQHLEVQEENHPFLSCGEKSNSRLQVWANSYNVLENNNNSDVGDCVDSNGRDFFLYNVNGSIVVSKRPVSTKVFPKCCPLKHAYNHTSRSCMKNESAVGEEDFIAGQFVKVGLPHCQIIVDKAFQSQAEATFSAGNLEPGSFCLDRDVNDEFLVRQCREGLDICKEKRCFKKCCPDGKSYVGGGTCKDTYVHGLKLESQGYSQYIDAIDDNYELIYGSGCPNVSILPVNKIQYSINKQGDISYYHNFSGKFLQHNYSNLKSYCLEHATKGRVSGYHLFWCIDNAPLEDKFASTLWAKTLSCILLLVTIVVYFYLGEVRSTFGKILINYCLAMICLMVILMVAHVSRNSFGLECKIRAYSLIFFNMSAFAWVNIMSIDIWWTFGSPRRTIGSDQKKKDLKKFLLYLLYGWGMPLCHTLLILFFDSTSILPEAIQPYVGIYQCFLESRNYARTVLFLIPQLIFQIINTVLFIKTIIYCIKVKNEISKMNDSVRSTEKGKFKADKERLSLIVKLAVIMGIIWIFEVTTAFFQGMKSYNEFTKILEVVMDTITCLQGVFIFLIFICKTKTFTNIKKKLGLGERRISCTMSVTQTTNNGGGHYPMNKRQTTLSLNDSKI